MARRYMRAEKDLIGKIPKDMLRRNPQRFAILTQQAISHGWDSGVAQ
jgi:hypothetical protein